jgi:hypothetical protein
MRPSSGGAVLPYEMIRSDSLALQEAGAFAIILATPIFEGASAYVNDVRSDVAVRAAT